MPVVVTLCGGFLLGVLWMDLLFDVQVLRQPAGDLPESVLSSIAGYYRRVTTQARPMSHVVAFAMLGALVALVIQVFTGPRAFALCALPFCIAAVALAITRVVPDAVRLGARADAISAQSRLARAICRNHFVCLAAMLIVVTVEIAASV